MKIFISHSHDTSKTARALSRLLMSGGDRWEIINDQSAEGGTVEAKVNLIRRSDVVIALLGAREMSTVFEVGIALGANKQAICVSDLSFGDTRSVRAATMQYLGNLSHIYVANLGPNTAHLIAKEVVHVLMGDDRYQDLARQERAGYLNMAWREITDEMLLNEVRDWFVRHDIKVEVAKRQDREIDLIAHDIERDCKYVVDIKAYPNGSLVSVDAVRSLASSVVSLGVRGGILVTSSDFTNSAKDFAERIGCDIHLWSVKDSDRWSLEARSSRYSKERDR